MESVTSCWRIRFWRSVSVTSVCSVRMVSAWKALIGGSARECWKEKGVGYEMMY